MDTLAPIIAALEKASGPDRALDGLIALACGHEREDVHGRQFASVVERLGAETFKPSDWDSWSVPPYTDSLDAAAWLIGKVLPGWWWIIGNNYEPQPYRANVGNGSPNEGHPCFPALAPTPPLALLLSLCRALASSGEAVAPWQTPGAPQSEGQT